MDHPSADTMWRYANAALPSRRRRAVRDHALGCAACRRELSRTVVARRALGGDALRPTRDELAAWEGEILVRASGGGGQNRLRWAALAGVLAATSAAALMLMPRADDDLTARGGTEPLVAVRVLCVESSDATRVIDPTRAPCPAGSFMKVMVGNLASARPRYAVVAVSGDDVWHLYPGAAGEDLAAWPVGVEPLAGSFELSPARRGRLRVVLLAAEAERLAADDPVWAWAAGARPGDYRDVLDRFDAVVIEVEVGGEP